MTWTLFLTGVKVPITADFNRRMQTGSLMISGKIVFQWKCEDPAESDELPYNFTREHQKFSLIWLETDLKESFELKVNGGPLSSLEFLDPSFQISNEKPLSFEAQTIINDLKVTTVEQNFEHLPGVLLHKILDKIGEQEVTKVALIMSHMSTPVVNETLAALASLNIPETTGLDKLHFFYWRRCEKCLNWQILEQLVTHC